MRLRLSFMLLIVVILTSCSKGEVKDSQTKEVVEQIGGQSQGNYKTFDNQGNDWMSRKHGEYDGLLAIDESFYKTHEVSRGDVIYYKTPEFDFSAIRATPRAYEISRVVAMPGETLSIKKGQIYINGKKLLWAYFVLGT